MSNQNPQAENDRLAFEPLPSTDQPRRIAVIGIHGIGTHLPGSMLAATAANVRKALEHRGFSVGEPEVASNVGKTNKIESRMDFKFFDQEKEDVVHTLSVFEGYYSPYIKGKMNAAQILSWLVQTGVDNLEDRSFTRQVFKKKEVFPSVRHTGVLLLALLIIICSLIGLNAANGEALAHLLNGKPRPSDCALVFVGCGIFIVTLLFLLCRLLFRHNRKQRVTESLDSPSAEPEGSSSSAGLNLAVGGAAVAFLAADSFVLWARLSPDALGRFSAPRPELIWLTTLVILAISYRLKAYIENYGGDVATYANGYYSSAQYEVRVNIRKRILEVFDYVHDLKDQNKPAFDTIVVMGHSLGSVVAFDTLNKFLLERYGSGKNIRFRGLLTYGSPLDKISYLFRPTSTDAIDLVAKTISSRQPLIDSIHVRKNVHWVNLYTASDIVAGKLDYFDPSQGGPDDPPRIKNVDDPDNNIPIASHSQYDIHGGMKKSWHYMFDRIGMPKPVSRKILLGPNANTTNLPITENTSS